VVAAVVIILLLLAFRLAVGFPACCWLAGLLACWLAGLLACWLLAGFLACLLLACWLVVGLALNLFGGQVIFLYVSSIFIE
jgi:hypothetical protein